MNCIYCKQNSDKTKGIAHIFPEGLMKNEYTLPKGFVCDKCNQYLSDLDTALIHHNHIWPWVMIMQLPGKSGKPRQSLGYANNKEGKLNFKISQKNTEKITVYSNKVEIVGKNTKSLL